MMAPYGIIKINAIIGDTTGAERWMWVKLVSRSQLLAHLADNLRTLDMTQGLMLRFHRVMTAA